MKDKNDQAAVNSFKAAIDEYINFITNTAYTAGLVEGKKEKLDQADKTCNGCVHYKTDDNDTLCFDCERMIRDDLYEVQDEDKGN